MQGKTVKMIRDFAAEVEELDNRFNDATSEYESAIVEIINDVLNEKYPNADKAKMELLVSSVELLPFADADTVDELFWHKFNNPA